MIEHLLRFSLPAAYALLPANMNTPAASAMLLAIALQESKGLHRRQVGGGPGRGFWQFERGEIKRDGTNTGGTTGVVMHPASRPHLLTMLEALRYPTAPDNEVIRVVHDAVAHNDTLAAGVARLLLWTIRRPLPTKDHPAEGWLQYSTLSWNPGSPRPATWEAWWAQAWVYVGEQHG